MKSNKIEILERVRVYKDQPGVFDTLTLFEIYIEEWKETLVASKGDQCSELQGAIKRVREIISDIRRNNTTGKYKNGAYTGE